MSAKIKNNCCKKQCFVSGTYTFNSICNKFAYTTIVEITLAPGTSILFAENGITIYNYTNSNSYWYKVYVCIYISPSTVMIVS